MIIRFHKGQFVDAVIPTAVQGTTKNCAQGDVVWELPADINPSKTINVIEPVQAVDPLTGQPLFNEQGMPIWQVETMTNPDGTTSEIIARQQVPKTYTLIENPGIFTPEDIAGVIPAPTLEQRVGATEKAITVLMGV